ncbi:MAG TPA: SOS response-associated peptidase [Candidatus Blautia excrementipullorum]|nr:SOS response-associated peptidase [Candidatus Blautia excrementipullorum]
MCCQYFFDDETMEQIEKIAAEIRLSEEIRKGNIRPSDMAAVITGRHPGLYAEGMKWGFPSPVSGQLMINARAETALEKRSFSDSTLHRRCVIPAKYFYEWDASKNKVTFSVDGRPFVYMAGIYNRFADGDHFTVLTTAANDEMIPVHDRMPLILKESQLTEWIYDSRKTEEYLKMSGPALKRQQEYEQLTLF